MLTQIQPPRHFNPSRQTLKLRSFTCGSPCRIDGARAVALREPVSADSLAAAPWPSEELPAAEGGRAAAASSGVEKKLGLSGWSFFLRAGGLKLEIPPAFCRAPNGAHAYARVHVLTSTRHQKEFTAGRPSNIVSHTRTQMSGIAAPTCTSSAAVFQGLCAAPPRQTPSPPQPHWSLCWTQAAWLGQSSRERLRV